MEEEGKLQSVYCSLCGTLLLVIDAPLFTFPVREKDNSFIFRDEPIKNYLELNGHMVVIKREPHTYEKQPRVRCK